MRVNTRVKICGLKTPQDVTAAVKGGAAYVGFVFYPPSPRALSPQEAGLLSAEVPKTVKKVALVVDADDALLDQILAQAKPDMLQLHGTESAERVAIIKKKYGLPVIKALPIACEEDAAAAKGYESVADLLLFDAKPPKSLPGALPGGNGLVFDWTLLAGQNWEIPWMLSGGLTADNIAEAVKISRASILDVSSGVEREKGVKDEKLITAFLEAAARS